ncbi:S-layer homology domain-containing protein [Calothrix sp. 336/3]|uniref:S-layer homology domain-containing protein n=1 Tax=Calothrix sp. 336/3 TaxID=1337936 RepID=UPI0004E3C3CD|nr:S-layer homology domain-containing protein [Calothrix sp. 336/3]AKG23885.1 hypothetical protein IJ00_23575 [Calothrix sp. 336/3]
MLPSDPKTPSDSLGFDDFIGILVAFGTIGAILFWGFTRKDTGWNLGNVNSPSANVTPTVVATGKSIALPQSNPEVKTDISSAGVTPPSVVITSPVASPIPSPQVEISPTASLNLATKTFPENNSTNKTVIPPPIIFTDLPSNHWSRKFINALSSRNIIKGFDDYSFRPNQAVNRAEYAAILKQAFNQKLRQQGLSFQDVPTNYWAGNAINQSIGMGFLKGYPNNTFNPNQRIPRVQVLVSLVSGLGLKPPSNLAKVVSIYKDAKDIPPYAVNAIAAATKNGLVVNYPDRAFLNPNQPATRGEVAVMIHQALVKTGRLEKTSSPYLVSAPQ